MNIYIFIAGIINILISFKHLFLGSKWYLKPILDTPIKAMPKAIINSIFNYLFIFQILSSITLLFVGSGYYVHEDVNLLIKFIGINYIIFSIIQIYNGNKHNIPNPFLTMYSWMLYLLLGTLCLIRT